MDIEGLKVIEMKKKGWVGLYYKKDKFVGFGGAGDAFQEAMFAPCMFSNSFWAHPIKHISEELKFGESFADRMERVRCFSFEARLLFETSHWSRIFLRFPNGAIVESYLPWLCSRDKWIPKIETCPDGKRLFLSGNWEFASSSKGVYVKPC